MNPVPDRFEASSASPVAPILRGRLFRKYATIFIVIVCSALVANGAFEIWFSYREQKSLLVRIQHEQAEAAAARIREFVTNIENQMGWATQQSWDADAFDDWRFDATRFMRDAPAVTEVAQLDRNGRELYRLSRQAADSVGSLTDHSRDPFYIGAMSGQGYFGSVYFVGGSEPHMTLALAGEHRNGVIVAQIDLRFIWDVVSRIKVGGRGYAYVVDADGRLIAHPDISLVLRNTSMTDVPQVRAAQSGQKDNSANYYFLPVDLSRSSVLSANAMVDPLNWRVFVDLPTDEAFAPVYASIIRSAGLLLAAIALALLAGLFLARRMVVPIRALLDGAARLGSGDLAHRISIKTADELEALGNQFNAMATSLQNSHATLEQKVEERTRQLEAANLAKSRFLAAASHDLRQPLHAVGLFVAQLRGRLRAAERRELVDRIEAALAATSELFNVLLDISKLDAGGTTASVADFPVARLLAHVETTFAETARNKGLSLRIVQSRAWVKSDFVLLERVVFNLVANAVRYTPRGKVVVGCRLRRGAVRIEVWDTGVGIPNDQHEKIFGEFYRLGDPDPHHRAGLGLGLAIVDRLCRLLGHRVEVRSVPGLGSTFGVTVPVASVRSKPSPAPELRQLEKSDGKLVLVIDDDPFVLNGMDGILRSWGCRVITAESNNKALDALRDEGGPPDLIISDYYLSDGTTGIEAVERLRAVLATPVPAFLVSGDINIAPLSEAKARGFHLLHKPVDPMTLRAMFQHALLKQQHGSEAYSPSPTVG